MAVRKFTCEASTSTFNKMHANNIKVLYFSHIYNGREVVYANTVLLTEKYVSAYLAAFPDAKELALGEDDKENIALFQRFPKIHPRECELLAEDLLSIAHETITVTRKMITDEQPTIGYEGVNVSYTLAVTEVFGALAALENNRDAQHRSPGRWLFDLRFQLGECLSDWNLNTANNPAQAKTGLVEGLAQQAAMCIAAISDLQKNH